MDGEQTQVLRDDMGRLLPGGANINPEGRNGHNKGWQRYSDRIQKWLNLPISELRQIANSPETIKGLSTIDAICIRHVVNSLKGHDVRQEREAMLDRIEGKPKQTTILENPNGTPLMPAMAILTPADGATAYQEVLKRASEPAPE